MTTLADKVAACSTWSQLFDVALNANEGIDKKDGDHISGLRFCSSEQLNERLRGVSASVLSLNSVTNKYGFRDKAKELLERD
ncbi:MAG: hypothetical protein V3T17_11215 [Pseudomonadales bacterium]